MELYADSAMLSFVIALVMFLGAFAVGDVIGLRVGTPLLAPVAMVGGGVLAVWVARLLERRTSGEPMSRAQAVKTMWVAGLVLLLAAALATIQYILAGTTVMAAIWVAVSIFVGAVALALGVDLVNDIIKTRAHIALDVVRFICLGVLGASWVPSAGSADTGAWVVIVSAYMVAVALAAFAYDEFASWRARTKSAHGHMEPT